jgi:hypothetical protein
MRRLRDILRLKYEAGLPHRAIAQACAVGLGTVSEYLARATAAGVVWPLPEDLDDAALEARLFARPVNPARPEQTRPVWSDLHQELKRPGVTLQLCGRSTAPSTRPGTPTATSANAIASGRGY